MTGPTRNGHLLSSCGPPSQSLGLPLPSCNGISDTLARSTIELHDTTWPCRTLERRRAFQLILNRYNRQILYGCKNPYCETPTCLSRRRRVTKGPFRPYTVLSARTLATFLASQDHPEKGLCPHLAIDIDQGPWPPAKEAIFVGKKSENPRNSLARLRSSQAALKSSLANGAASIPRNGRETGVQIANEQTQTLGLKPEIPRAESHEEPKRSLQTRKNKDPKSFTQNLFDTVAIDLLSRSDTLDERPPWAPSNERVRQPRSTKLDGTSLESKTDKNVLINAEEEAGHHLILDTEFTKASQSRDPSQCDPIPGISPVQINATSSNAVSSDFRVQGTTNLDGINDVIRPPDNHRNKQLAADNEEIKSAQGATDSTPTTSQASLESKALDNAGTTLQPKTSVLGLSQLKPSPKLVAQSLSHFTFENITALWEPKAVRQSDLLYLEHCVLKHFGRTDLPQHSSSCGAYGDFLAYSGQSMTYILSNVDALLRSFLYCAASNSASKTARIYDFPLMVSLFRMLGSIDMHPCKIFPSLWISAGRLYPFSMAVNKRRPLTDSDLDSFPLEPNPQASSLNDLEACHIAKIIIAALVASVPKLSPFNWSIVRKMHASAQVDVFIRHNSSRVERNAREKLMRALEAFESQAALRLAIRFARLIDIRYHLAWTRAFVENAEQSRRQIPPTFSRVIAYVNANCLKIRLADNKTQPSIKGGEWIDPVIEPITWHSEELPVVLEWLRAVILKEWDGKPRIAKGSAVRGALGLSSIIYEHADALRFDWDLFHTPFLAEHFDCVDEPTVWLNSASTDDQSVHLLDFPFLFPPLALVNYFRSINYTAMYGAYRNSIATSRLCHAVTWPDDRVSGRGAMRLHDRLRFATTEYLVLEARRDHVLMDAMNQIYRRQKRELMRPLKVRILGEEGIDHGGVQQEFFRVAIAEALNPDYGLFTTEPATRMSWFHPSSPEPAYKFEMLGILVSLALYNGLTLPFTFPLVMYRKLLGLSGHTLSDLEDGWPELVKGLKALRDWKDGDVEDVFTRAYVFSIDKFGATEDRLIGQYEKPERSDEEKLDLVGGKSKKIAKVLRIKRKPMKVSESAVELREEGVLDHLRGDRSQRTTSGSNEVSMSTSHPRVPLSTGLGDLPMLSTSNGDEASELLSSCGRKRAPAEMDEEVCMSDSSSPNSTTAGPTVLSAPMVTNENRDQYIQDYIHQLTNKTVNDQFNAFSDGFFACIQPKAISLFTPSALKALVEGLPDISVADLEKVTQYDGGYESSDPTIRHFWAVVHSWPQDRVRKLLEFVTASDRLPAGGVGKLVFMVQRNGIGDGRLPTSLTCFGRLLLPEYTSEEKLRMALEKAIEHSKGFGQP